jgi:hypothetical protein
MHVESHQVQSAVHALLAQEASDTAAQGGQRNLIRAPYKPDSSARPSLNELSHFVETITCADPSLLHVRCSAALLAIPCIKVL